MATSKECINLSKQAAVTNLPLFARHGHVDLAFPIINIFPGFTGSDSVLKRCHGGVQVAAKYIIQRDAIAATQDNSITDLRNLY